MSASGGLLPVVTGRFGSKGVSPGSGCLLHLLIYGSSRYRQLAPPTDIPRRLQLLLHRPARRLRYARQA